MLYKIMEPQNQTNQIKSGEWREYYYFMMTDCTITFDFAFFETSNLDNESIMCTYYICLYYSIYLPLPDWLDVS